MPHTPQLLDKGMGVWKGLTATGRLWCPDPWTVTDPTQPWRPGHTHGHRPCTGQKSAEPSTEGDIRAPCSRLAEGKTRDPLRTVSDLEPCWLLSLHGPHLAHEPADNAVGEASQMSISVSISPSVHSSQGLPDVWHKPSSSTADSLLSCDHKESPPEQSLKAQMLSGISAGVPQGGALPGFKGTRAALLVYPTPMGNVPSLPSGFLPLYNLHSTDSYN